MAASTDDGRPLKILTVIDEYTRECLAIVVARKIRSRQVLERLADLFIRHGVPTHIRPNNALSLRPMLYSGGWYRPGSPWENGYIDSFNGKMRDEMLKGDIFDNLLEARVLTERWRQGYNHLRPRSSLGCRPPAPETAPICS